MAEVGEKPEQETVPIRQRGEIIRVFDRSISYPTSKPIPSGKRLKKVGSTPVPKDKGQSKDPGDHGSYRGSWTRFGLSTRPSSGDSGEKWRSKVVRNLHTHSEFKEHTIEILDRIV